MNNYELKIKEIEDKETENTSHTNKAFKLNEDGLKFYGEGWSKEF